eukprot:2187284-Prorocentrum_lima.AAC.1
MLDQSTSTTHLRDPTHKYTHGPARKTVLEERNRSNQSSSRMSSLWLGAWFFGILGAWFLGIR